MKKGTDRKALPLGVVPRTPHGRLEGRPPAPLAPTTLSLLPGRCRRPSASGSGGPRQPLKTGSRSRPSSSVLPCPSLSSPASVAGRLRRADPAPHGLDLPPPLRAGTSPLPFSLSSLASMCSRVQRFWAASSSGSRRSAGRSGPHGMDPPLPHGAGASPCLFPPLGRWAPLRARSATRRRCMLSSSIPLVRHPRCGAPGHGRLRPLTCWHPWSTSSPARRSATRRGRTLINLSFVTSLCGAPGRGSPARVFLGLPPHLRTQFGGAALLVHVHVQGPSMHSLATGLPAVWGCVIVGVPFTRSGDRKSGPGGAAVCPPGPGHRWCPFPLA